MIQMGLKIAQESPHIDPILESIKNTALPLNLHSFWLYSFLFCDIFGTGTLFVSRKYCRLLVCHIGVHIILVVSVSFKYNTVCTYISHKICL